MNLQNKVAIVTGAGRGIGKAIALTLAREGANIIVNDINLEIAQNVADKIKVIGRRAVDIYASISKKVNQMVSLALSQFDRINIFTKNTSINKRCKCQALIPLLR